MSIKAKCSTCAQDAVFSDSSAGKKSKCRNCGTVYVIPAKRSKPATLDSTKSQKESPQNADEEIDFELLATLDRRGKAIPSGDSRKNRPDSSRKSEDGEAQSPLNRKAHIAAIILTFLITMFVFLSPSSIRLAKELAQKERLKKELSANPLTLKEINELLDYNPPSGWLRQATEDTRGVAGGERVRIDLSDPGDPTVKSAFLIARDIRTQEEMIADIKKTPLISNALTELPGIQIARRNVHVMESNSDGRVVRIYAFIVPEKHLYFNISVGASIANFQRVVVAFERSIQEIELKIPEAPSP